MQKKSKLFLWISFVFFSLSVIAILLNLISSFYEIKSAFPNDDLQVMNEFGLTLILAIVLMCPFLGSELSLIRSVYKILKHNPNGSVKVCYAISSVLAFFSVALQCLVSAGLINFGNVESGQNFTVYILLFTEWPLFVLSFILGSIRHKRTEH